MHSHYQNEMNWKGNATSREYKSEKHEFYGQSSLEVSNSCTEVFHTGYLQQVCIARLRKLSKSFHSTSKVLSWKHDFKSNTNDVTFLWRSQLVMADKKNIYKTVDEGINKKEYLHIYNILHTNNFNGCDFSDHVHFECIKCISSSESKNFKNMAPWIPLRYPALIL